MYRQFSACVTGKLYLHAALEDQSDKILQHSTDITTVLASEVHRKACK